MTELEKAMCNDFNLKHVQGTIDDYIDNIYKLMRLDKVDKNLGFMLGKFSGQLWTINFMLKSIETDMEHANELFNQD
jgi:hypothetical protein